MICPSRTSPSSTSRACSPGRIARACSRIQGHVLFGGALSGRDPTAVQKTVSGLLKLLSPDPEVEVPEADLAWAVRSALECRRRVKEQQKRIGSAEFRNTHFSYQLGDDGVEKFVGTPELYAAVQNREPDLWRSSARSSVTCSAIRGA